MSIKAVITDFDNTLFDWVKYWYNSFSTLLNGVIEIGNLPQAELIKEVRAIHQKYGTSEYSFLLQELEILKMEGLSPSDIVKKYTPAIDQFRTARKESLVLYPSVLDTLIELKKRKVIVAIYTESQSYYAKMRLKHLKLDGVVDFLFSPEDQKSEQINISRKRKHAPSHYDLMETKQFFLDKEDIKPNPQVLIDILKQLGVKREETIYVGDSLRKDILMANRANVRSVYASYGTNHNQAEYELLKQVSHWTDEDIKKEQSLQTQNVKADYIIDSFSEVLDLIDT